MGERSSYPDGEPCWADVVTPDLDGALRFYQAVFGWQFQSTAPEFRNYTMALVDGKPVAGIMPPSPGAETTPATWNVYLASSDVEATAARAGQGGAKIVTGPLDIPGSGRMLAGLDPTGAVFGVWQPAGHPGAQLTEDPNTPLWAELHTRDGAAADAFYRSLFDYQQEQIGDGAAFDYTVWSLGGRQVCGRMRQSPDEPAGIPPNWLVYFAVDDTDAAAERVTTGGGQATVGPFDSPQGRVAILTDPYGAVFAILDPSRRAERR
jgi:predicted enzyme related to lactoylglutathione lyase